MSSTKSQYGKLNAKMVLFILETLVVSRYILKQARKVVRIQDNSKIKLKKRQNKKEENRPTKFREIFDSFCESPLFG